MELVNICCFKDRVKLNNPLMGTETLETNFDISSIGDIEVKLNNPLMGTETPFIRILLGKIILMLN